MFLLISPAFAATYVILDEPSNQGLSFVAARTGLPYEELVVLDLDAKLRRGVPDAEICQGPPVTQAELHADLTRALQAYDAGDVAGALARAETWAPGTACLKDPVDADWLWFSGFVTGVFAWAEGDEAAARRAWAAARSLDPQRPWDDNFAPGTALHTFATSYSTELVSFRTVGGPFLVDGGPARSVLSVGPHVLQAGDPLQTWRVEVRTSLVALHPDAEVTTLPLDELTPVLASQLPSEPVVYAVRGDVVMQLDLSRGTVTSVRAPVAADTRRRKWGPAVAAGGLVLVAGGLVTAFVNLQAAAQASEDGDAASIARDDAAWLDARDAYDAAVTRMYVGYGVAGVGAVAAAIAAPNVLRKQPEPTAAPSPPRPTGTD